MDLAVLDDDIVGEDADAVAGGVEDLAVAQRDVVGGDLDAVAALPVAIDQVILVDAGLGDEQAVDLFRVFQTADRPFHADRLGLGRHNAQQHAHGGEIHGSVPFGKSVASS